MFKKKKNDEQKVNKYTDSSRQLAFFGFYLVFFVVIIILLRTGLNGTNNNNKNNKNSLTGYGYDYKLNDIVRNNYHFVYKENVNDIQTIYEGDILNSNMSFTKSGIPSSEYYETSNKIYVKDNNLLTWSETTEPMRFKNFVSGVNIQSIISTAKYVYRTEYNKEDTLYFGYTISNNELRKIFQTAEVEGDQEKNAIIVITDKSGNVKSINFDLTNYYKTIDQNINKYTIMLNYSKYNEIKEITNPLN
jgi:hypothetical protein